MNREPQSEPNPQRDPLQDHLLLEARRPLAWQILERPLAPEAKRRDQRHNAALLHLLAAPEVPKGDAMEGTTDLNAVLQRLEMKIDRILKTLATMAQSVEPLPKERELRLSAAGIGWRLEPEEIAPSSGDRLVVEVYPDERFLQGLRFTGRVVSLRPLGAQHEAVLAFGDLGNEVEEALTRYIFQQHRQELARQRES